MPIGNISAKTSERRIAHARDRRDAFQVLRCIASLVSCRCIISLPLTRDAIPLEAIIPRNYFSMMNRALAVRVTSLLRVDRLHRLSETMDDEILQDQI